MPTPTINAGGIADSKTNLAAAAAPAANAAVTIVSAPGAGKYRIEITTYQLGTVDTNRVNMNLFIGATLKTALLSTSAPTMLTYYATVAAGEDVGVYVGGTAAGASSVYVAQLAVQRVA